MGIETERNGSFRLKEGLSLVDVVKLWDEEEEDLPEPGDDQWSDDETSFSLLGGELYYTFSSTSFWYAEKVGDWMAEAASSLAAEAWTDYDTSHDGAGEEIYGPSHRARLEHKIFTRRIIIQDAEREIEAAQAELDELGD